uniref:Olfactory receptor n=1 Tax=Neovison vison TaxID=452646 RepID=A0A8C7BTZ3_NEOVI
MILMENISELQVPLFMVFTIIYFIILVGNIGMIVLILLDSRLHTPMYFFLSNLSLVDCVYASAVTPKVMVGFSTGDKIISYNACAAQMFFFSAFATIESFLLSSMAFDRHAAVCKPLHYTTTMTSAMCTSLVTGSYICGLLQSSIHVALTFHLSFCHSNIINHFFCDIPPLLALSCSDIHINEIVLFTLAAFNVFFTLLIHSAAGRHRAFSTCSSHLSVVLLQYGCCAFVYMRPSSSYYPKQDQFISLVYTLGTPLLNPLIYTLRNSEIKGTLGRILTRNCLSHNN